MNIISIFKSIDGEVSGFGQGRITTFVRLATCNLRCKYCDTTYSFTKGASLTVNDVFQTIKDKNTERVTITGGEPLLQRDEVGQLIDMLIDEGKLVSIETNGSFPPIKAYVAHPSVSWIMDYKLPSSDQEHKMDVINFKELSENDYVKFLIQDMDDLTASLGVRQKMEGLGCCANFAYSPIGSDKGAIVDMIIDHAIGDEVINIQLHKVLWPDCGASNEK